MPSITSFLAYCLPAIIVVLKVVALASHYQNMDKAMSWPSRAACGQPRDTTQMHAILMHCTNCPKVCVW